MKKRKNKKQELECYMALDQETLSSNFKVLESVMEGSSIEMICGELLRFSLEIVAKSYFGFEKSKQMFETKIAKLLDSNVKYTFMYSAKGEICHYFENTNTGSVVRIY